MSTYPAWVYITTHEITLHARATHHLQRTLINLKDLIVWKSHQLTVPAVGPDTEVKGPGAPVAYQVTGVH